MLPLPADTMPVSKQGFGKKFFSFLNTAVKNVNVFLNDWQFLYF